jgi:asparagine synthase (glutamine-hydrolysing)
MCGLCGIIEFSCRDGISPDRLKTMIATLKHRGPDYQHTWAEGHAGLAHARLSIIDLTPTGRQPMISSDERFVIVFNGEVYNFPDIRRELELLGTKFRGHSDTEVVLEAYVRWGEKVLPRFNGIFALAIWDKAKQELILARDRYGVKPLYYARIGKGLVFASEIKAILASQLVQPAMNVESLHEFAYYGVALGCNTMFKGIKRLDPGHWLKFGAEEERQEAFWELMPTQNASDAIEDATAKIRFLLEQAVKRQLVSDVPVGIFLSGGIDSSCVTAFAAKHYSGKIRTYSVGFDFDRCTNELPKARQVAACYGTEHHELHISGDNLPPIIESLIDHHDEPFSDAANIPLFLLCRELKGEIRVVLQGDGGDEIFAGYRRYALLSHARLWEALSRFRLLVSQGLFKNQAALRLRRILDVFAEKDWGMRMALLLTTDTPKKSFADLMSPGWRQRLMEHDPFARYRDMAKRFADYDGVQKMLFTDCKILLPDIFLEKVDKSTMASGIESRVPFLDNDLTDYVLGLPSSMKIKNGEKKFLLKRALRRIVPDNILDGPKTGFEVPYSFWLREPLAAYSRDVLMDACSGDDPVLDRDKVARTLSDHKAGDTHQNAFILWKALNFALWQQHYL